MSKPVLEGKVADYLKYWGLKEEPTRGRDFVHTDIVDQIVDLVKAGRSIRVTGEAGIGKSATIREVKTKLEQLDSKYVIASADLRWLVDTNSKFITKDGLIALSRYVLDAFDDHFKKHEKESLPPGTNKHREALVLPPDNIGVAERFYHLQKFFHKISSEEYPENKYKLVIVLDDADVLQSFLNFDNLDSIIDMVPVIFSYKPSEEKAMKMRVVRKDENQTHTELAAQREQLEAFLRRSAEVRIRGQTAATVLQIIRGKLAKKDRELLTDEAVAYGLMASCCGRAGGTALDVFTGSQAQLLYNPGKAGVYLSNCLRIGYDSGVKPPIGADVAKRAYEQTIGSLRAYDTIGPNLENHLRELEKARQELAKT